MNLPTAVFAAALLLATGPFGVEGYHALVRQKIDDGVEGYAQSDVRGVLVSYDAGTGFPGGITHGGFLDPRSVSIKDIIDEMVLDVARGEGIASDRTFTRAWIERMLEDRRGYPDNRAAPHREAALLGTLLRERPGLFK